MKKTFLSIFMLYSFGILYAQKVNFSELTNFLNKQTNSIAEELLAQGYEFSGDNNYPSFQKNKGDDNISIELYRQNQNYIQLCASNMFNAIFTSIETDIKVNSKKSIFFYSPWLKNYVTEYKYKNKIFVYVGQGICSTLARKKMKFIQISDSDLKQSIFLYDK